MTAESRTPAAKPGHTALRFVLLLGVVSLFADFAYEGSRSVLGPYLAMLGASAFVVGTVTGFGELAGYGLRLFSGPIADRTGRYWPITLLGYAIQMIAVPALAFTHSWPAAAALIVAERAGRAIRNPPKDAMLSHAGKQAGGVGWAFGLNEALDQTGAMVGPLVMAAVLALRHDYHLAFAVLAFPAAITLVLMVTARLLYPRPQELEHKSSVPSPKGLPRAFWIYMAGAALAGAGLADYPLIAYHFVRANIVPGAWIAVFYSVAMATSGAGSPAVRAPVRPVRLSGPDRRLADRGPVRPAGLSRRVLDGARGRRSLGRGHRRLRIDHSRRGDPDGRARAAGFGLWPVHGGLRHGLVRRQRPDRIPLRPLAFRCDRLLRCGRAGGHPVLHLGRPVRA